MYPNVLQGICIMVSNALFVNIIMLTFQNIEIERVYATRVLYNTQSIMNQIWY